MSTAMKVGYLMLELPGLDLTETDPQTITGSYAITKAAAAAGKPVWIYGVDGYTPIPATISEGASSAYVISFLTYTATVATTSAITVVDLTA